jgi:hypothetical protein
MKKWLKYLGYAFLAFTILGVIAVATDTKAEGAGKTALAENDKPAEIPFSIVNKDMSPRQITYRLTIDERTDKASIIEIARKLKLETGWKDELVCFFNINVYSASGAWASCAYLPACEECATDKDKDGNPVQFTLIGATPALADSLQRLSLDTIENKKFLCSYIEDMTRCKTELYTVSNNPSKLLKAQLFNNGGYLLEWLTLRVKGGEKRYYYNSEDEINYLVVDQTSKLIHFRDGEDKTWQSLGIRTN